MIKHSDSSWRVTVIECLSANQAIQYWLCFPQLAALASDERDEHIATAVEALEHEWNVVAAQEQLPRCVLDEYGFDAENMRVLTPRYGPQSTPYDEKD